MVGAGGRMYTYQTVGKSPGGCIGMYGRGLKRAFASRMRIGVQGRAGVHATLDALAIDHAMRGRMQTCIAHGCLHVRVRELRKIHWRSHYNAHVRSLWASTRMSCFG